LAFSGVFSLIGVTLTGAGAAAPASIVAMALVAY
jgi:hypothetical protein